jgi:hypothetical protein
VARITGAVHEDQYMFLIIPRSVLLKMKTVSDKRYRGTQNTYFMFSNFFFKSRTVYEIMWKNIVQPDRPQLTIWRMRIVCWVPKATNTQSENVILIDFTGQQWLRDHASMLCYTYIACLVNTIRTVYILTTVELDTTYFTRCMLYVLLCVLSAI